MGTSISHGNWLEREEIKGLKLFITLFYLFLIGYDLMYYYVFRYLSKEEVGLPDGGLSFWYHFIFIILLPVSLYLKRLGKVYAIKYLFLLGYIVIDIINNLLIYYGNDLKFLTGNVVELIFLLFSSIFLNKRFFWFTAIGMIFKYIVLGIVLQDLGTTMKPAFLYSIISIISFILLTRFYSNLRARLKAQDDLRHAEKLATVGRFATSISHEVRNPLASLKGFTQLQKEKHPEDGEYYNIMTKEIDRITSILDDLLIIGKPKGMNFEKHDCNEIIEYVFNVMESDANNQGIHFTKDVDENVPDIECDAKHIKQVLINLFKNGIEAMPSGGKLNIKVESCEANSVRLTIEDTGEGISKENLEKLGTPFHTTKPEGTGLGLMVTFKIIEEHHGTIQYDSEEGKGTTVSIILPVTQTAL